MGVKKEILSFFNGADALEEFQHFKDNQINLPDIILLDINMPIMDGWEFLHAFRKIQIDTSSKIPIYIVSSSIANEDIEKSKLYPEIIDYLTKPLELDIISSIISASSANRDSH